VAERQGLWQFLHNRLKNNNIILVAVPSLVPRIGPSPTIRPCSVRAL
jgi:hypothetical protein